MKSTKGGLPQISTTEGEHGGRELVFVECLLSCGPGLCWCPISIIPLDVHNSPTEQVLLFSLFHRRRTLGTRDALLHLWSPGAHLLPPCSLSPAAFRPLEPSMTAPSFEITIQREPASLGVSHTMWEFVVWLLTRMRWLTSKPGLVRSKHGTALLQTGQVRNASHFNRTSDPQ